MNPRHAEILRLVVEEYIRTAEPVSSRQLCDGFKLPFSSATVRNDLAALEKDGYLMQPHTSAGRVPTEVAYRFYIQNFVERERVERTAPDLHVTITVRRVVRAPTVEDRLHNLGAALAEASGEAVMLSTTRPWSATLGIANLLRKPDFRSEESILSLAESLEKLDGALHQLLRQAGDDVQVVLGMDNPLGPNLASVVVRHRIPDGHGIMAIVGPIRMNYARNMALLTEAKKLIEQPQIGYAGK